MNKVYLLTGGNLGDREKNLQQAADHINATCGQIVRSSSFYETAAWGKTDQPAFLNQALELHTRLRPEALMEQLLDIESAMGRKRTEKMGPRIIDIDMLLYEDKIMDTSLLKLPHPALPQRRFALAPLADIAPGIVHPVLGKTISRLLQECSDTLPVHKLKEKV
jgi:2-amino-4-hydroxy-6-hydroxymethyldihydropteridine diphosphokinase